MSTEVIMTYEEFEALKRRLAELQAALEAVMPIAEAFRGRVDKEPALQLGREALAKEEMMSGDPYIKENDGLRDEIARLQELLRGTGANRYWEGRWRDADAENQKFRAALDKIVRNGDRGIHVPTPYDIAKAALARATPGDGTV